MDTDTLQIRKEKYDTKYIEELREYFDAYFFNLINEIFVGTGIALGLTEKEAYNLARKNPNILEKAEFFKSIFQKLKNVFSHKVPKFRPGKGLFGTGKPLTPKQWEGFEKQISDYWKKYANKVTEDITVKSFMLGKNTAEFRTKKKPYKNKSLYQINFEQYKSEMPSTLQEAYKKYDFNNAEKNALNQAFSNVAMYVTEKNNDIKEAIRKQVQEGINDNKSSTKIASDLYWEVQKGDLSNKYKASALRRNWDRVANTELAYAYEAGILAQHEADAMESLKDSSKAQYFVRTGGTCDWCKEHQGTLVRLVPKNIVKDTGNESLSEMGIEDPNTDIAIWVGKNNVGRKKKDWLITCPAHPYNVATFQKIDIENEWYNPKTGDVERRQKKQKFVPQQVDFSKRSKEEKESRKPKFVSDNLVSFNNSVYEAVDPDDYNRKLEASRKDPTMPIPVNKNSPAYRRIFGEAEK